MPTYRYACPNCGKEKEEYLYKMNPNITQICPKCGAIMERLIGAGTSFNMKGKGFYKEGWQ